MSVAAAAAVPFSDLSTADAIIIVANVIPAMFAVAVNVWDAKTGYSVNRPLRISVAVLASLYVVGYLALLGGAVSLATWGQFFRGISPIAWLLVWAGPPLQSRSVFHHVVQAGRRQLEAERKAADSPVQHKNKKRGHGARAE
jgi:hypothetical protein